MISSELPRRVRSASRTDVERYSLIKAEHRYQAPQILSVYFGGGIAMLKLWIIIRQLVPSHLLTASQCPLTGTSFPSGPFRSAAHAP